MTKVKRLTVRKEDRNGLSSRGIVFFSVFAQLRNYPCFKPHVFKKPLAKLYFGLSKTRMLF